MEWSTVATPDVTDNVLVSPSEINFFAAGPAGITLYALDIPHNKIYKSTSGGSKWTDISAYLTGAGAALPAWNIAIAPDNPDIIAVVTSTGGLPGNVFLSTDGGNNWQNTNCAVAANIGAIDISVNHGSHDIVIGTRTGAGGGSVSVFQIPGYGGWIDQGFSGDVIAVKCSPNYPGDSSLVLVSASGSGSYVNIGIRDFSSNSTNWATWGPVEITTSGAGTSPKANQILTADLELPFDFLGQVSEQRRIYVCTNDGGVSGNTGIYRIDDTLIYNLTPSTPNMISSIAFYGDHISGELLAGEFEANASQATVETWYSPNAGEICPMATCILWQRSVKPPTGGANSGYGNAQVAWSPDGTKAYCVTSSANLDVAGWPNGYLTTAALDESAFSVTLDNGKSWNQLALIDTVISFLSDIVSSIYSDTLYLASINTNGGLTGFDSLWRCTSYPLGNAWERVLCTPTTSDDAITRMSTAYMDQSILYAARSTSTLLHSVDKGQTWITVLPNVNITDFSVTEIDGVLTIHVLANNQIRSGAYNNQIWHWKAPTNTTLNSGHTIYALPTGLVLVGDGGQGTVAYSLDNGTQFTQLPPVPDPGNMHVIADPRISNYVIIYAASDAASGKVYVWVVGKSPGWTSMNPPGQGYYGITQISTLYCARSSGGNTAVDRTLNPEMLTTPELEWGSMTSGLSVGVVFTREPSSLKDSDGVDIWAIDNRAYTSTTGRLWNYYDCLSPGPRSIPSGESQEALLQAPEPIQPTDDTSIPVDTETGKVEDIEFKWRHPTMAAGYELAIAEDEYFDRIVVHESITPINFASPSWVLTPKKVTLDQGKSYYWKVRVNRLATYERINGEWSITQTFTTADAISQPHHTPVVLIAPGNNEVIDTSSPSFQWTSEPEATEYEIVIAADESLQQIIRKVTLSETTYSYDEALDPGSTYYWQVRVIKPYEDEPGSLYKFTITAESETTPSPLPKNISNLLWIMIGVLGFLLLAAIAAIVIIYRKVRGTSTS
jgi:hypothetical protein